MLNVPFEVLAQRFPKDIDLASEDDPEPIPIASRHAVLQVIRERMPFADFSDPDVVKLQCPEFWVTVELAGDNVIEAINFECSPNDEGIGAVGDIMICLELSGSDGRGDPFDPTAYLEDGTFQKWLDYRKRAVA